MSTLRRQTLETWSSAVCQPNRRLQCMVSCRPHQSICLPSRFDHETPLLFGYYCRSAVCPEWYYCLSGVCTEWYYCLSRVCTEWYCSIGCQVILSKAGSSSRLQSVRLARVGYFEFNNLEKGVRPLFLARFDCYCVLSCFFFPSSFGVSLWSERSDSLHLTCQDYTVRVESNLNAREYRFEPSSAQVNAASPAAALTFNPKLIAAERASESATRSHSKSQDSVLSLVVLSFVVGLLTQIGKVFETFFGDKKKRN
eukprot:m.616050 g.616050  ORF g.616050 m.616050 type:complete len:254 (-) comp58164_c1_seq39:1155-1916(-)